MAPAAIPLAPGVWRVPTAPLDLVNSHAGGAAEMLRRTGAALAVHERDAEYARSGRTPPRDPEVGTVGRLLQRLPDGGFAPLEVGEDLRDEQVVQAGGGLRVLHTPGHTPGHVSLPHEPSRETLRSFLTSDLSSER